MEITGEVCVISGEMRSHTASEFFSFSTGSCIFSESVITELKNLIDAEVSRAMLLIFGAIHKNVYREADSLY